MKKLILVLCVAIVLVAAVCINNAMADMWYLCYGTVTWGMYAPFVPAANATVTCTETGWTTTTDENGNFKIAGKAIPGTYHIVATKDGVWRAELVFYYNGAQKGTNVGILNMRPVD